MGNFLNSKPKKSIIPSSDSKSCHTNLIIDLSSTKLVLNDSELDIKSKVELACEYDSETKNETVCEPKLELKDQTTCDFLAQGKVELIYDCGLKAEPKIAEECIAFQPCDPVQVDQIIYELDIESKGDLNLESISEFENQPNNSNNSSSENFSDIIDKTIIDRDCDTDTSNDENL